MDSILRYKVFEEGQEYMISDMIWEVFAEFEGEDYSEEGNKTFKTVIQPQRLASAVKSGSTQIYCCFDEEELVGVLALRDITHISLLFVKKTHHRRGIAKTMLELALIEILKTKPQTKELTVNSSPYAVDVYRRLGFNPTSDMLEKDGILYMPMKKCLG